MSGDRDIKETKIPTQERKYYSWGGVGVQTAILPSHDNHSQLFDVDFKKDGQIDKNWEHQDSIKFVKEMEEQGFERVPVRIQPGYQDHCLRFRHKNIINPDSFNGHVSKALFDMNCELPFDVDHAAKVREAERLKTLPTSNGLRLHIIDNILEPHKGAPLTAELIKSIAYQIESSIIHGDIIAPKSRY